MTLPTTWLYAIWQQLKLLYRLPKHPTQLQNLLVQPQKPQNTTLTNNLQTTIKQIKKHRLASYIYATLDYATLEAEFSAYTKLRKALRPDFMQANLRHAANLQTLQPLLAAWHTAGIATLVYKGFALATTTYARKNLAAARIYSDVDVLLLPKDVAQAEDIAAGLGWRVAFAAQRSISPYIHEALHLWSPDGKLVVEVHSRLLQNYAPFGYSVQARLTQAAWQSSVAADIAGVAVQTLAPCDAVILGIALNRAWSEDRYYVQGTDYIDMKLLAAVHGITEADVLARADELFCGYTVRTFLKLCNPWQENTGQGTLYLGRAGKLRRLWWGLRGMAERPLPWLEQRLAKVYKFPGAVLDLLRELGGVLLVVRWMRREQNVETILAALTPDGGTAENTGRTAQNTTATRTTLAKTTLAKTTPTRTTLRERQRLVRGIKWSLWLLRVKPGGNCLPRSLALYRALRQRGVAAMFYSGFTRNAAGVLEGHAWIEVDGHVLDELNEPLNRQRYKINLSYPPEAVST